MASSSFLIEEKELSRLTYRPIDIVTLRKQRVIEPLACFIASRSRGGKVDARSYHLRRPRFYTREQSKSADSLARSLDDTAGEQHDFFASDTSFQREDIVSYVASDFVRNERRDHDPGAWMPSFVRFDELSKRFVGR